MSNVSGNAAHSSPQRARAMARRRAVGALVAARWAALAATTLAVGVGAWLLAVRVVDEGRRKARVTDERPPARWRLPAARPSAVDDDGPLDPEDVVSDEEEGEADGAEGTDDDDGESYAYGCHGRRYVIDGDDDGRGAFVLGEDEFDDEEVVVSRRPAAATGEPDEEGAPEMAAATAETTPETPAAAQRGVPFERGCVGNLFCQLVSLSGDGPLPQGGFGVQSLYRQARDEFKKGDFEQAAAHFVAAAGHLPPVLDESDHGTLAWICDSALIAWSVAQRHADPPANTTTALGLLDPDGAPEFSPPATPPEFDGPCGPVHERLLREGALAPRPTTTIPLPSGESPTVTHG